MRVCQSWAMRRHVRKACKIVPSAKNGDAWALMKYEYVLQKQQAEIDELRVLVRQLTATAGTSDATNTEHIQLLGEETTGHVTREQARSVFEASIQQPSPQRAAGSCCSDRCCDAPPVVQRTKPS